MAKLSQQIFSNATNGEDFIFTFPVELSSLKLQIEGSGAFEVTVKTSLTGDGKFYQIPFFNELGLVMENSVKANGLYSIDCEALNELQFKVISGTGINIYAKGV